MVQDPPTIINTYLAAKQDYC